MLLQSATPNTLSAISTLFLVDSLVPRKNMIEVCSAVTGVMARDVCRSISSACDADSTRVGKKSYSEQPMYKKWRKYECANIDNAEYSPPSPR
jgi:hypothetical protein